MPRFLFGVTVNSKPKVKPWFSAGMFRPTADIQKPPPGVPDFARIPPPELALILAIANRASKIAHAHRLSRDPRDTVVEVNTELVAIDVAIVHLSRRLNLKAFFECDDLAFMSEYARIEKNIERASKEFPVHVPLSFASIGANFKH